MRYGEGLDTTGVFDLAISVRSRENKGQSRLAYHLHYGETCAPAASELAQSTTFGVLVEASLFSLTG